MKLEVNSVKTQKAFFVGISEGKIGQPGKTAHGGEYLSKITSTYRMTFWFVSADSLGPKLASRYIYNVDTPSKNIFRSSERQNTLFLAFFSTLQYEPFSKFSPELLMAQNIFF